MGLLELIHQRIGEHGPLSVADYMDLCLTHPEYGYYMRRDPLGTSGDFTTAPEISQIFGELIGLWLAAQWQKQNRPACSLVELGPGRGTLMADLLRATQNVRGFHDALTLHLVETSPVLQQKQWKKLAGTHPRINWHTTIESLPDAPLCCVANEFFDALPIRQFIGTHERQVVLNNQRALAFSPAEGEVVEDCPAAGRIMHALCTMLARHGGAMLLVDYGYIGGSRGDTLQSVKQHAYHNALETPGEADLTAHVDFDALAQCAEKHGLACYGAMPQGKFLLHIGASQRLMTLCGRANDQQKKELMSGFERLIAHEQMGELFKVLAVLPPSCPRPEGF